MFCVKYLRSLAILLFFYWSSLDALAQPIVKEVLTKNRQQLYKNLVQNSIQRNLQLPLTDSTEENWMRAFDAICLLRYQSPLTDSKVVQAFDSIHLRTEDFQQSLMQLAHAVYRNSWQKEIQQIYNSTQYTKIKIMAAAYLCALQLNEAPNLYQHILSNIDTIGNAALIQALQYASKKKSPFYSNTQLKSLLHHPFENIKGPIVFSLQRSNRNYPGIVIVRDTSGQFIKNENGQYFSVPQLAQSMYNLPFFLTYGNTPQGIFRMHGSAVSRTLFIGPTPNLQLTLPKETSIAHFLNDSTIKDSVWTISYYQQLLPPSWKNTSALNETFYAGMIGRSEIIAHGSTVNPSYYQREACYPITPSLGCLSTKEIWNEETGHVAESDQQLLMNAINKAGGTNGYLIVLDLNDLPQAVQLGEILHLLHSD
ncbi:MAG: hypothetical protein RLY16_1078 [Bacteroidota bacterium]